MKRAYEYLKENNLENDKELRSMIKSRDAEFMGGEGHLKKHNIFEFEYTQKLNDSLNIALTLSKTKVFKTNAKFETQTIIIKCQKVILELYFDGAEKEAREEDEKKLEKGLMTKEAFADKW